MVEKYPAVGFQFEVTFELGDATENDARFQEVSGLNAEIGVETLQEGGENRFAHRLPGRAKFGNLTLKRGLIKDTALVQWFKEAAENLVINPVDVTVSLMSTDGEPPETAPLVTWHVVRAYPVKWSVSALNAQNNAVAVDTLELAFQYFWRE